LFDQELCWHEQTCNTIEKTTKWIMLFKRLARSTVGLSAKMMRQLYTAVAIPKMTYAADVWYTPVHASEGLKRRHGSVGVTKALTKIQRVAALAVTGALRTTPTDYIEAHSNILPIELLLKQICFRAFARLASLPDAHPLAQVVRRSAKRMVL
jgi:hypothetical protein